MRQGPPSGHARLAAALSLAVTLAAGTARAGVTREVGVGKTYDNIQGAIEASSSGDRVLVYPGVYVVYPGTAHTVITYGGRDVVVESTNPHDPATVANTIIELAPISNYQTRYSIVAIVNGESRAAVFRGFTVRKGRDPYYGAGIRIGNGAGPTIEHCVFEDNDCTGGPGGAILSGGPGLIQNCRFENNHADEYLGFESGGGAVCVREAGEPIIRNNVFTGNSAVTGDAIDTGNGGAIKVGTGSAARIYGNVFDGNEAPEGSAVEVVGGGTKVYDNRFVHNVATGNGGTVYVRAACEVYGNVLRRNQAPRGGGVALSEGAARLHNNVICDNTAEYYSGNNGGGVYVDFWANGSVIENNTIAYNKAIASPGWAAGANLFMRGATVTIRNNIIAFGNEGGGLYVFSGTPTLSRNDVFANGGGNYVGVADPTGSEGNLSVDPLFVLASDGNYHLSSRKGHFTTGGWVADAMHSPCIDAGPALAAGSPEPMPNGGRRNLGAYGDTNEASKSFATPAPKPDMRIRGPKAGAAWVGNNVYSPTGKNQRVKATLKPGQTAVFGLMVQNDETDSDAFIVFAEASPSSSVAVKYYNALSGGRNVTAAITSQGWKTPVLARGVMRSLRLEAKAEAGAPAGVSFDLSIWAASVSDPKYTRDLVKARVETVTGAAAARLTALSALPTGLGAEIGFALSADAQITATVRNVAGRPVRVLCCDRTCGAGRTRLVWDARDDQGLVMPRGAYLVELVARAADGSQSRAVASLRLVR